MDAQLQHVTINSGDTISSVFQAQRHVPMGIWFPTVTSGVAYVQGSWINSAANFVRILSFTSTNVQTIAMGVGSIAVQVDQIAGSFPYLRIETDPAQVGATVTSLVVITKP